MSQFLFDDFDTLSPAAWKQKIQVDLKGADYNDSLLWKTEEGITIKPFYTDNDRSHYKINLPKKGFNICQSIYIDDIKIAKSLALEVIEKGATTILFIAKNIFDYTFLFKDFDHTAIIIHFQFHFLDSAFNSKISEYLNSENIPDVVFYNFGKKNSIIPLRLTSTLLFFC